MKSVFLRVLISFALVSYVTGCANIVERNQLAGVGAIVGLAYTPTTVINQTYYLGVFDPQQQLPPTIYRIRVQGQASALSRTNFASGWVRADLIDSLTSRVSMDAEGKITFPDQGGEQGKGVQQEEKNKLNRRLVMFGPEGFREAPKDHRLVIVMGSSPEAFFNSVDSALGIVAGATQEPTNSPEFMRELLKDLSHLREERRVIETIIAYSEEN